PYFARHTRKEKGGISYQAQVPQSVLTQELVTSVLREFRISNANVILRCDATVDQLIDVIEGNRKYMPAIYVLNKIDQLTIEDLDIIAELPHHCPISAHHGWNLDELMEMIWDECNMLRMYVLFWPAV